MKFKLIHKETGLTFNQYKQLHRINDRDLKEDHCYPCLVPNGNIGVYVDQEFYPYMFFINRKDWEIVMKVADQ